MLRLLPQDDTFKNRSAPSVSRLVACDKFVLDRRTFSGPAQCGGDGRCHILMVLDGTLDIERDPSGQPLQRGGVVLLPAESAQVTAQARGTAVVLDVYLP